MAPSKSPTTLTISPPSTPLTSGLSTSKMDVSTNIELAPASSAEHGSKDARAAALYRTGMDLITSSSSSANNALELQHLAIEHFAKAIALRGSQSRYFFARGNAHRALTNYREAIEDFSTAIKKEAGVGSCAQAYAARASCFRRTGEQVRALEDITFAIELDYRKGPHYLTRAGILVEGQFYQEAILDYTSAIELADSGPKVESRAYLHRGSAHCRLGDYGKWDTIRFERVAGMGSYSAIQILFTCPYSHVHIYS